MKLACESCEFAMPQASLGGTIVCAGSCHYGKPIDEIPRDFAHSCEDWEERFAHCMTDLTFREAVDRIFKAELESGRDVTREQIAEECAKVVFK